MGYRSQGRIYLSDKAQQLLSPELRKSLDTDWDKDTGYDNVWSFDYWKWYSQYEDIKIWEEFIKLLSDHSDIEDKDWDICIVGEDGAIYEGIQNTYSKFNTYTIIEVY
jgi:hypothetical protein